jgi:hypothetical protein
MALWQLMKVDQGKYLFAQFPRGPDEKVVIVEDLSTYKQVECHSPK